MMAAAVRVLTLPGVPESVRRFRELAREASVTEYQAEAAALCVSELVTNAIVHTWSGRPGGSVAVLTEPAAVPGALRISVFDSGGSALSRSSAEPDGRGVPDHGYGLGIVAAVAADWGQLPVGAVRAWCTWCEIPADPLSADEGQDEGQARDFPVAYELTTLGELACEHGPAAPTEADCAWATASTTAAMSDPECWFGTRQAYAEAEAATYAAAYHLGLDDSAPAPDPAGMLT